VFLLVIGTLLSTPGPWPASGCVPVLWRPSVIFEDIFVRARERRSLMGAAITWAAARPTSQRARWRRPATGGAARRTS